MDSQLVNFAVRASWVCPLTGGDSDILIEDGVVVVADGIIVTVCVFSDWIQDPSIPVIHLKNRLLIPGFINCHTHAAMSLLRGYADDMRLDDWLENAVWPVESKFMGPTFVELGTKLSIHEMLTTGTTTILDMYFYASVTVAVAELAGIRVACGETILDIGDGELSRKIDRAFTAADHVLKSPQHDPNFVIPVINAHAVYTVPERGLIEIKNRLSSLPPSTRIQIHLHESQHECDNYSDLNCGKSAMEKLIDLGLFNSNTIAAHCVCLSDTEKNLLAVHQVNVVHCPKSNQKLSSGVCPVQDLLDQGVNVALGTDGACSNNSLSMISEMQSAALLAKSLGNAQAVSCRTALKLATYNGAKALGMVDRIGSIEVGKFADFVAIDLSSPACQPVYDPVSALVYTTGAVVDRVWVHGKELVKDGKIQVDLDLDWDEVNAFVTKIKQFKTHASS